MLATYASALLVLAAAAAVGQAVFRALRARALVVARPGRWAGRADPRRLVVGAAAGRGGLGRDRRRRAGRSPACAYLRGGVAGLGDAARVGLPVAALALLAASLPFLVEGRFGILGTGLNPDMSQHLFAADRLRTARGPSA